MTPDMRINLRGLLMKHEGYALKPYTDTVGKITIGIGRNLSDRGILPTELDQMFNNDVDYFYNFLSEKYLWFPALNMARQVALVDLCFMGTVKFAGFVDMLKALGRNDYPGASKELLNSLYASEVGQRATDLAQIILTGELL